MLDLEPSALDDLRDPVLVVAFDGWVSAGSVGTATAEHLADEAPIVARFDPDALYDYRVSRPSAHFRDGVLGEVGWPELTIRRRPGVRDLLVMSGPEPNWNWRRLTREVTEFVSEAGIELQISLGGIPWAAPHTRPTVVTTTASRPDLLGDEANEVEGSMQVPAAAAIALERSLADSGTDTIGLWARVPHYVGGIYYPAVVTLTERVAQRTGVPVDLGPLVEEAAEQRRRLDETMAGQPQVESLVQRYEELYDAGSEIGSGEEIAAEFERFLRQQGGPDTGLEAG